MRHTRALEGPYVLIAIGVGLLLWNFGYIPRDSASWWPVLLIALGVLMIILRAQKPAPALSAAAALQDLGRRRSRLGAGVFLIGVGVAFLLGNMIGKGSFPALLLIAIGLAALVNRYW